MFRKILCKLGIHRMDWINCKQYEWETGTNFIGKCIFCRYPVWIVTLDSQRKNKALKKLEKK